MSETKLCANTPFERALRYDKMRSRGMRLVRVTHFWEAVGCSWSGRLTKRDGHVVGCGHQHYRESGAKRCLARMKRERPGACQDYRTVAMIREVWRKK